MGQISETNQRRLQIAMPITFSVVVVIAVSVLAAALSGALDPKGPNLSTAIPESTPNSKHYENYYRQLKAQGAI